MFNLANIDFSLYLCTEIKDLISWFPYIYNIIMYGKEKQEKPR